MNRRFAAVLALLGLIAYGLLLRGAFADEHLDADHDRALRLREAGDIVPLESILRKARKLQAGTIIEVELEEEHKRVLYEVDMLDPQGVVWELEFDARTGEEVRRGKED